MTARRPSRSGQPLGKEEKRKAMETVVMMAGFPAAGDCGGGKESLRASTSVARLGASARWAAHPFRVRTVIFVSKKCINNFFIDISKSNFNDKIDNYKLVSSIMQHLTIMT